MICNLLNQETISNRATRPVFYCDLNKYHLARRAVTDDRTRRVGDSVYWG